MQQNYDVGGGGSPGGGLPPVIGLGGGGIPMGGGIITAPNTPNIHIRALHCQVPGGGGGSLMPGGIIPGGARRAGPPGTPGLIPS